MKKIVNKFQYVCYNCHNKYFSFVIKSVFMFFNPEKIVLELYLINKFELGIKKYLFHSDMSQKNYFKYFKYNFLA